MTKSSRTLLVSEPSLAESNTQSNGIKLNYEGALKGAVLGAQIGSPFGAKGRVTGAAIGGAVGLLSGDEDTE